MVQAIWWHKYKYIEINNQSFALLNSFIVLTF